jgi:hypothetical protein
VLLNKAALPQKGKCSACYIFYSFV